MVACGIRVNVQLPKSCRDDQGTELELIKLSDGMYPHAAVVWVELSTRLFHPGRTLECRALYQRAWNV